MIKIKQENLIINFIFFSLFLMFLNNANYSKLNIIGGIFILLVLSIGFVMFLSCLNKIKITKYNRNFIIFSLLILAMYFIGIINNGNMNSIITFAKISLLIIFCFMMSMFDFSKLNYLVILEIGLILYLIIFFTGIIIVKPVKNYNFITSSNALGSIFLICVYFSLLLYVRGKKIRFAVYSLMFFILILFTRSRASILVLTISMLVLIFWNVISKNKFTYSLFLTMVFISIFVFILIYTYGNDIDLFIKINAISKQYVGKNLFSGRDIIWKNLFKFIRLKPILGYGGGIVSTDLYSGFDGSTHSFYLQVLIQVGWLGMFFWLLLFKSIWSIFWHSRYNKITILSSSFFIGILIQNAFELTFYSNKIFVGIMQWLIIAIGMSQTINKCENNL